MARHFQLSECVIERRNDDPRRMVGHWQPSEYLIERMNEDNRRMEDTQQGIGSDREKK